MTNTIIICHVLTPPAKYEKFIVGSQPMRMREYTTMNNNKVYYYCLSVSVKRIVAVLSRTKQVAIANARW